MRPLICDHLIIGAGSTGLAVADHLLRREAGSVILIDSQETPQARIGESRVPLLFPAGSKSESSQLQDHARRGLELYEGWSSWLEKDPGFRQCGALMVDEAIAEQTGPLDGQEMQRRWSGLGEWSGVMGFDPQSGIVDGQEVLGALLWRLRKFGGRFYGGNTLQLLEEQEDGVQFVTSRREGFAGKVYLCHGAAAPFLMKDLGVRHRQNVETLCEFTLGLSGDLPPLIHWPEEKATLYATEPGAVELHLSTGPGELLPGGNLATAEVGWKRLGQFRETWDSRIPGLSEAVIRKARARHRRVCDSASLEVVSSAFGRIFMPAAAGEFQELLFPALSEVLVEQALSGSTGGLLEDLGG